MNAQPLAIDMRGIRIGHWTVTGKAESRKRRAWWVCVCDCGGIKEISGNDLRREWPRELHCRRCDG